MIDTNAVCAAPAIRDIRLRCCDVGDLDAYAVRRTYTAALVTTTTRDLLGGCCFFVDPFPPGQPTTYTAAEWRRRFGVSPVMGRYVAPAS